LTKVLKIVDNSTTFTLLLCVINRHYTFNLLKNYLKINNLDVAKKITKKVKSWKLKLRNLVVA